MLTAAWILVGLATLAALYIAKVLVVDISWADFRGHRNGQTARMLAIGIAIGAAIVALPLMLGWDPLESTCRHASLSIL